MSFVFQSKVEFPMDRNQLSKICQYEIGSILMMSVTISKIKDLLLLGENHLVDPVVIHCHDIIKACLLQVHETTKKVIHNLGQSVSVFIGMTFHLLYLTGNRALILIKLRMMKRIYEQ